MDDFYNDHSRETLELVKILEEFDREVMRESTSQGRVDRNNQVPASSIVTMPSYQRRSRMKPEELKFVPDFGISADRTQRY